MRTILIITSICALTFSGLASAGDILNVAELGVTKEKDAKLLTDEDPICVNSLYGQNAHVPSDPWTALTSDQGSSAGYIVYDNFSSGGLIEKIKFWGFDLEFAGGWFECFETPNFFEIKFYDDNNNMPGNVLHSFTVGALAQPMGIFYLGSEPYELIQYEVDLEPGFTLNSGWISIQGLTSPASCMFLWLSAMGGDGLAYQWDGQALVSFPNDFGFCLEEADGGTLVYQENFDNGMGGWSGQWGLATVHNHSAPNSLSDSPDGNYQPNSVVNVELTTPIDLTSFPGARVEFWTRYDLENNNDYVDFSASTDGGNNWELVYNFDGEGIDWYKFNYDLGRYCGENLLFKLTLETNSSYEADGMYVDDFAVYGLDTDITPPNIIHTGPDELTSVPDEYIVVASITDYSGVLNAFVIYTADWGTPIYLQSDSTVGDFYYFTIPQHDAGTHIHYYIESADNANNIGWSETEHYISGSILYYDDGNPEITNQYAPNNEIAVRMSPASQCHLTTCILKFHVESFGQTDSVAFMIWDNDSNGFPNQRQIVPFNITPFGNPSNPDAPTYVDLRDRDLIFSDDFHIGFIYRSEWPLIWGDSPAVQNRSSVYEGGNWVTAPTDLYIRAIVDYEFVGVEDELISADKFELFQCYPNPFNASTTISYYLKEQSKVEIKIYDLLGRVVETFDQGTQLAGRHELVWNANDLPSGVYFYSLRADQYSETKKMLLLK